MNPRIIDLLSDSVGLADKIVKAERVSGEPGALEQLEQLLETAQEARRWPNDPGEKPYVDDLTVMLLQCLRNAEREGPLGDSHKWILLAKNFLPLVRPELARALDQRPTP